VRARRLEDGGDLLTDLVHKSDAGLLGEAEVCGWGMFLLVAGHEKTSALIANGLAKLLSHPGSIARLAADPALLPGAIDELLSYDSPIQKRRFEPSTRLAGRQSRMSVPARPEPNEL
jgi:cytochrome P450